MASTVRGPGKPGLVALCALASASGLWGLFLWTELISSRSGGQVFCPLGEAASCTALWDSGFATAIHTATGLPIAGWGLIWGLVALAVALALLGAGRSVLLLGMLVATAAAGTVAVLVLMVVSIAAGTICGNCLLTYLLVCGFVGVVFSTTRGLAPADLARGGAATAALTAVFLVVLLYPGSRTPLGAVESRVPDLELSSDATGSLDERLAQFVADLGPPDKRAFADALEAFSQTPVPAPRPARGLHGSPVAPVRLTDFTDTLCGHCAVFHSGLEALEQSLPAGSFSVEERQFPLDNACNAVGPPRGPGDSVRCRAALARICMEATPDAFAYSSDLFRNQETLSAEQVVSLAARYTEARALVACMDSAATKAKLQDDIDWALAEGLRGTPMVLVNGRLAPASPPFLYALILARGDASHPAFAGLTSER